MTNIPNELAAEFLYYNRWANLQLIDACSKLAPEQLASSAPGTYGTIYDTLVHIVRSEAGYFRRLSGVALPPSFDWETRPPLPEIRAFAERVSTALAQAAGELQMSDSFRRDWDDPDWEGQRSDYRKVGLLIQVVNHGVEHRTNITTILAQQGIAPPALDGWEYMRLNPDRVGL